MRKLFTTQHGSRLFGTQTPTSDLDIKHLVLPDLADLVMGRPIQTEKQGTNEQVGVRNGANDVDEEFIPLQIFARHFLEGQAYAIEMAFALDGRHAGQVVHDARIVSFLQELRTRFLTSNIRAMTGYAVKQATMYSLKGERLNVVRAVRAVLAAFAHLGKERVGNDDRLLDALANVALAYPTYFRRTEYDIGQSGSPAMRPCFRLLEKTIPFTLSIENALRMVTTLEAHYGDRAKQAAAMSADWKATMHAVRIVDGGLRLLREQRLAFPLPPDEVAGLLAIRRGEIPYEAVSQALADKLDALRALEAASPLPALTPELETEFDGWLQARLLALYGLGGPEAASTSGAVPARPRAAP